MYKLLRHIIKLTWINFIRYPQGIKPMANVKLKLFANIREIAQTSSLSLEGNTVKDILLSLVGQHPQLKEHIFEKDEELKVCGHINIFLNGNNTKHMEGLETVLNDDDELGIFPPVSGG